MTGAVVLAAGRGARFGMPKAGARSGDGTFVESVVRSLRDAGIVEVRVVLSGDLARNLVPHPVPREFAVVNPDPSRGMLSSIQCGLEALPPSLGAVLVWPVDHPRVRSATILALVEAHAASGAPVVVPVFSGVRGHPVLFDARVLAEIMSAPFQAGARSVVHAHADRLELTVEDAGVSDDIDSPGDYARVFGEPPAVPRSEG